MATFQFYAYAPGALVYNATSNTFTLRADFDPDLHRVLITITDDDALVDGDQYQNEVGDDANQTAVVTRPDGSVVASGRIYDEAFAELTNPGGGLIDIERMEIGGVHVGYLTNQALTPGYSYPLYQSAEVVASNPDTRIPYSDIQSVPCFGAGTMIATDQGALPVDWLRAGDRVLTRDMGYQPLLWTGRFEVAAGAPPEDAGAVAIAADAFGPGLPARAMRLTPSHRILLHDAALELHFGEAEMFAAACHLVDGGAVRLAPGGARQVFYHLLLAEHQVILAEGLWVESLFAGDRMVASLPARTRKRIADLIGSGHRQTARACLKAREIPLLPRGPVPVSGRVAA